MFSNRTETQQISTEDASSEFKLVTEVRLRESDNKEINREARYVAASDYPQPIVRREQIGGLVNDDTPDIIRTTISVDDLPAGTITRTTTSRLADGIAVSSTSKLG